jgi:hypothetical protein
VVAVEPTDYEQALRALVEVADEVLDAVRSRPVTPASEEARSFLASAYGRGYQSLSAIRQLAAPPRCDADNSLVLARSLVSITAISLWVNQPESEVDRAYRMLQWRHKWAIERLRTQERLAEIDSPVDDAAIEQTREWVRTLKGVVEEIPDDRRLLEDLDIPELYAKVHRPGSDVAHFSFGSAASGFVEEITPDVFEGRVVALDQPRPAEALDALVFGMITYGEFLVVSEPALAHGVSDLAHATFTEWWSDHGFVVQ